MKRLLLLMFAVATILICAPALLTQAWAAGEGDLTFSLNSDGETCTVTDCSTSVSGDFEIPSSYNGYPVTSIGYEAFCNCSSLTSITIPDSVTSIGYEAFYNCDSLTSITIPDGVTSIGNSAFYNCYSLTSITIPDGVTSIGYEAFYNCSSLTSITIPEEGVTSIGNYAFRGCRSLTSITIPDSVTSIGDGAFSGCKNLTSVTIPDSVTSIGDSAFYSCSSLTSIAIPDSVTRINKNAFTGCSNLKYNLYGNAKYLGNANNEHALLVEALSGEITSCEIHKDTKTIAIYAFQNCTWLSSIDIPDSVVSIGSSAFSGCNNLKSMTIPFVGGSVKTSSDKYQYPFGYIFGTSSYTGGIATNQYYYGSSTSSTTSYTYWIPTNLKLVTVTGGNILYGAFYHCSNLTSVTIGNSVTSIGSMAFYDCTSLTSVTISDSVTSIGASAFSGCNNLKSMTIPFVGGSRKSATDTYQYPFGYIFGTYSYTGGVATTQYYYGSSTSSTTSSTYYIPSSLKSVTVTGGNILYRAFYSCSSLTSITIPDSVTSIGSYAFSGCSSLTSITIPDGVTSIGDEAFIGCSSLTAITIPDSVALIGDYAFSGCSNLNYNIYDNGKYLGNSENMYIVFIETVSDDITSCQIHANSKCIDGSAFYSCNNLTSITIPDSVTSIGGSAFSYCKSLASITIPKSVTRIGYSAFLDCYSLTHVAYTGTQSQWNSIYIGSNNTNLTNATRHYETRLQEVDNCVERGIYCPVCKEFISRIVKENGAHSYTDDLDVNCDACGYVRIGAAFSISQLPAKLGYQLFEELDVTGGVLSVTFNDGSVATIPMTTDMVTGFDASLIGRQQLTVTYGAATAFFTVEVVAQMPDSLELLTKPDKLSYMIGDTVDLTGLTLKAWYGEEEAVVTAADVSVQADLTSAGVKTATVTFQGLAVTFEIYIHEGGWKTLDSSLYPQSNHNYSNSMNETKTLTVPGATQLILTFNSSSATESNYDYVYVLDGNGNQIAKYTGNFGGEVVTVLGDTVKIKLTSDGSQVLYGYAFSKIEADMGIQHPTITVPGYAATCTQTGLTDGATCELCGETVAVQTEIPIIDHDWAPATCILPQTCTMCSGTQGKPLGHSGTWMTLIPPTETLSGIKARICDVCGETESGIIPPEVHSWSAWVTIQQPTCYESGMQMRFCLCGAKENRIVPETHTAVNGICVECGQLESYIWKLSADATVQLSLTEDLYLDMNGFDLTGTIITNGFKIYGKDSTTDGYSCESIGYFNCVDEKGNFIAPERIYTEGEKQYLAICVEDRYSFHRFFVGVTHMSLEPEVVGLGYKSAVFGDEMVFAELADTNAFSFCLQLEGYDPVYRYFDSNELVSGSPITLRIRNYDVENYSEHNLYAQVSLTLNDGTVIETEQVSLTFRWLTEQVNANYTDYTTDQLAAFSAMLQKFTVVEEWNIPNLLQDAKRNKMISKFIS